MFVFAKVIPKTLLVPFFSGHGVFTCMFLQQLVERSLLIPSTLDHLIWKSPGILFVWKVETLIDAVYCRVTLATCRCILQLFSNNYLRRRRRLCFWFGLFVCLSACLSVCRITYKLVNGFWRNFLDGVGHGSRTKWYNFGGDPDHASDPGVQSPKSGSSGSAEVCALWVLLVLLLLLLLTNTQSW